MERQAKVIVRQFAIGTAMFAISIFTVTFFATTNLNWSITWDIIYARSFGPFLYEAHITSYIFALAAILYLTSKSRDLPRATLLVGTMALTHEVIWQAAYNPANFESITSPYMKTLLLLGVTLFLVLAFYPRQPKLILAVSALSVAAIESMAVIYNIPITIGLGFILLPSAAEPFPNLVEIASWAIPSLLIMRARFIWRDKSTSR